MLADVGRDWQRLAPAPSATASFRMGDGIKGRGGWDAEK